MADISVAIIDDEPLARGVIRDLVAGYPGFVVVAESGDGRRALDLIGRLAPKVVFLDVQMPGVDGLTLLGQLGCPPPAIVFVTAFDDYAVRAFDHRAVDYLVKPFTDARFHQAMERVSETLLGKEAVSFSGESLLLTTGLRSVVVPIQSIIWIEAVGYYARVHHDRGRHLLRRSLQALEQELGPARFLRCHRSALVNRGRIQSVDRDPKGGNALVMDSGERVPVSERRRELVLNQIR